MKILLIYPPFCTPTIMPYSISYLKGFLKENGLNTKCLDLNAKFHKLRFKDHYITKDLTKFHEISKEVYAKNHKEIVKGKDPELLKELLNLIKKEKPDVIAFSIIYNSQNFYAEKLIDNLDTKVITGGPAVSKNIKEKTTYLKDEIELLSYLNIKPKKYNAMPDFSDYKKSDYLSKHIIIPVKASTSCFYKKCAFCTHHNPLPYKELNIKDLTPAKYYFFIDDMLKTTTLLKIAKEMKKRKAKWFAQLKPTKDLIPILKTLADSGLKSVAWGVESGSDKILKDMRKGTSTNIIKQVLEESKNNNIINILYIMFGFPTENRTEFLETITFLKENTSNIDLVSVSIFGLQKGSYVYNNPNKYAITNIKHIKRTVLDDQVKFTCNGLGEEKARRLRSKHSKTINSLQKLPKVLNYMKEQTLFF